jgi:hypothetical protein
MIILSIVGYILFFILIVLLIIILIPYSYHGEVERYDRLKIRGVVSWLFGGLKVFILKEGEDEVKAKISFLGLEKDINTLGDKGERYKKKKNGSKKEVKKDKKKSVKLEYFKKELIRKVLAVIKKLWRHCMPRRITAKIRAGFDNPMYTGYMCALYSQSYVLPEKYDIYFEPVFNEETIQGEASVEGRIWIAYMLVLALGLVLTKPVRKMLFSKG